MKSALKFVLLLAVLAAAFVGLAIYWTFYQPLPDYTDRIELDGLQDRVNVEWDEYGVPHIFAGDRQDLYRTMGYVHAQDRLWQMTLHQLTVKGRFAEHFGEELVDLDRQLRLLGLERTARQLYDEAGPQQRSLLQAYSEGVNAWIERRGNRLPVQFSLAGIDPVEWEPHHSLGILRMLAWEYDLGWWSKMVYGHLAETLDEETFRELVPGETGLAEEELAARNPHHVLDAPTVRLQLPPDSTARADHSAPVDPDEQTPAPAAFTVAPGTGSAGASNAWAADGSLTQSGYPMLAGDPHRALDIPVMWYEVHLNHGGQNVSGATIAGLPTVLMGQNDFMAWSFTSLMADNTDFFLEQINPQDRGQYVADSVNGEALYNDFQIEREIIPVHDSDDVMLEIRHTRNGPLIQDIHPDRQMAGDRLVSMQWTGHRSSDELGVLLQLNWAERFQQVRDVLPDFKVPAINLLYADITGNIARFMLGDIPRRNRPLAFNRGWEPVDAWRESIPFEELPHQINPDRGWVAHANEAVHEPEYPHYISAFWAPDARSRRIDSLITARAPLQVEDFKAMQLDRQSLHAEQITRSILPVLQVNRHLDAIDTVYPYLANWNFVYSANSSAASIMEMFVMQLAENLYAGRMNQSAWQAFQRNENVPLRLVTGWLEEELPGPDELATQPGPETNDTLPDPDEILEPGSSPQEQDLQSEPDTMSQTDAPLQAGNPGQPEDRRQEPLPQVPAPLVQQVPQHVEDLILESMMQAVDQLEQQYGEQTFEWRWENLHTLTLRPPFFHDYLQQIAGSGRTIRMVVNNVMSIGPVPYPGHGMTINKSRYDWNDPFEVREGPSMRRIVDLSDLQSSWSILSTGQSGSPFSSHYDDQYQRWIQGEFRRFHHHQDRMDELQTRTMIFNPGEP